MADLEAQIPALAAEVAKAGDTVKALKEAKASKAEIDAAVKELKRAKTAMDAITKAIAAQNANPFDANRDGLESLCKRRFFYRPAFEIYGGVAGFFTYGPPGCAVKNNLISLWRRHFVIEEGLFEIEDTNIMPHNVLKASGHVDRFNDFMVKDLKDEAAFFRADKLLEESMENIIKDPTATPEQKEEATKVAAQADGYSQTELGDILKKYNIKSPLTGNDLSDPYPFNLMFPTPIGPTGDLQGYLRPETAQGIFLNFKYCLEQNGGQMPFGMAQVGKAFRNEIAPRGGLIRQREFTQCEIEFFCKPVINEDGSIVTGGKGGKPHPKFDLVKDEVLTLFPSPQQLAAQSTIDMTVGEAVEKGIIANESLGYMVARTQSFLLRAGIKRKYLRFRQHLPTEMAHYACDCWDAEIMFSHGWVESVGVADRSAFDLNAHSTATGQELVAIEKLAKPIKKMVVSTKKVAAGLGKEFKADAKKVVEYFDGLSDSEKLALKAECKEAGSKTVEIDGKSFELLPKHTDFDEREETQHTVSYTPSVIEPSFGIDRILYAIFEHSYYEREDEAEEKVEEPKKDKKDKKKDAQKDQMERSVLNFPPEIAPVKCALLPLDMRVTRDARYEDMCRSLASSLSVMGISSRRDDSGVAIGRRYARGDELGIPFAITFDFETFEDKSITVRERDSCVQVRVPFDEAPQILSRLCDAQMSWDECRAQFPEQKQTASDKVGMKA
uniref:glycine--tRNA ligase n=2 Tax=Eutreptiella gymnastica TaxID=73025 RepID=A0A7S1JBR2_9EUGL